MSKQELNLHRQVQLSCDAPAGRLDDRKKDNVDFDKICAAAVTRMDTRGASPSWAEGVVGVASLGSRGSVCILGS